MQIDSLDISNILLIDDKEENLTSFEMVLEKPERNFLKALNGSEGIALANSHDVSLILLDVQMPGLSGFEVMQKLKSSPKTENIPIIFVSGIGSDLKYALHGYSGGAVDFINKPVNADFLRAKVNVFLRLETQRREIEKQNHLLKRLSMMVEHSADLMCILNKETLVFEEVNPAFLRILGYSDRELLNEKIIDLFADLKEVMAFEYRLQRYKNVRTRDIHFQGRLKAKDGTHKWVSINLVEQFEKWFVNGQDISPLKSLEARLRNYNDDLTQLTGVLAYEVKAPLNSGLYYLNLIRQESHSEHIVNYLDNVTLYMQRAGKLVDEIHAYTLSREEKNFVRISVSEIVQEAMENLQFELSRREAAIRFDNLPVIYGIEAQFVILFQNLISNSLAFCTDNTPRIDISSVEIKDKTIIVYSDNSNICKNNPNALGGGYSQLKTKEINLKICNTIIARHGGSISVASDEEAGTTYFISILKEKTEKNHE